MREVDMLVNTGAAVILSSLMDALARMPSASRPPEPTTWIRSQLQAKRYHMTFDTFRVLLAHAKLSVERGAAVPTQSADTVQPADSPPPAVIPPIFELVFDALRDLSAHFIATAQEDALWSDDACVEFATSLAELFFLLCSNNNINISDTVPSDALPRAEVALKTSLATLRLLHDQSAHQHPSDSGFYGAVVRLAVNIAQGRCMRALFDCQLLLHAPIVIDNAAAPAPSFPLSSVQIVLPVVPDADGVSSRNQPIDDYIADLLRVSDAVLKASQLDKLLPVKLVLTGPSSAQSAPGSLQSMVMSGERSAAGRSFLRLRSHEPLPHASPPVYAGHPSHLMKLLDPLAAVGIILGDTTHPQHHRFTNRVSVMADPLLDFSKRSAAALKAPLGRCPSLLCNKLAGFDEPAAVSSPPLILVLPLFGNCGAQAASFASLFGVALSSLVAAALATWRPGPVAAGGPSGAPPDVSKKPKKDPATAQGADPPQKQKVAAAAGDATVGNSSFNTGGGGMSVAAVFSDHGSCFSLDSVVDSCFLPMLCGKTAPGTTQPRQQKPGPNNSTFPAPLTCGANGGGDSVAALALAGFESAPASAAQFAAVALIPTPAASSASACWCRGLSVAYATPPSSWTFLRDTPLPFIAAQLVTPFAKRGVDFTSLPLSTCASQLDTFHGDVGVPSHAVDPFLPTAGQQQSTSPAQSFILALSQIAKLGLADSATESPSKLDREPSQKEFGSSSSGSRDDNGDINALRQAIMNQLVALSSSSTKSTAALVTLQKLTASAQQQGACEILKRVKQALAAL